MSALGQAAVVVLVAGSAVSGGLAWWGKTIQSRDLITPSWLAGSLMVHGVLNPLLCILFGCLLCHHIRLGWSIQANRASGLVMELLFAGLILSGVGLYYAGAEKTRDLVTSIHQLMGLLFPLALAVHWVAGIRWARRAVQTGSPKGPS